MFSLFLRKEKMTLSVWKCHSGLHTLRKVITYRKKEYLFWQVKNDISLTRYDIRLRRMIYFHFVKIWYNIRSLIFRRNISSHKVRYHIAGIAEGSRTYNGLKCHFCPSLRYLHREIRPVCPCISALIWTKIAILNFYEPTETDFVIENGSRSEGIPGVFQATRVVLCAKAVLLGVISSAPFGYITRSA